MNTVIIDPMTFFVADGDVITLAQYDVAEYYNATITGGGYAGNSAGEGMFYCHVLIGNCEMTFRIESPEVYDIAREAMASGKVVGISFKQKKDEPAVQDIQGLDA